MSVKIWVKYYGFAIFGRQIRSINSWDQDLIVHLEHHLLEDGIGLFLADKGSYDGVSEGKSGAWTTAGDEVLVANDRLLEAIGAFKLVFEAWIAGSILAVEKA